MVIFSPLFHSSLFLPFIPLFNLPLKLLPLQPLLLHRFPQFSLLLISTIVKRVEIRLLPLIKRVFPVYYDYRDFCFWFGLLICCFLVAFGHPFFAAWFEYD